MTASLHNHRHLQRVAPAVSLPRVLPVSPARPRLTPQAEGLLQIHTAPFRGSFSSVFSQALRSAGLGSRVLITQFLKGGVDQGAERSLWLCGRLQWMRPAVAATLAEPPATLAEPPASGQENATVQAIGPEQAISAVQEVWEATRDRLLSGSLDLVVLDELGLALELGYLKALDVVSTLEQRPAHLDVILTGPSMPPALLAMADQLTQLRRCA